MEKYSLPLVFDCDNTMGIPNCDADDGLALLYLLGSPEVELLGVTCSYGNSTQETVYRNTLRLLRAWGREDIPVLRGADGPADRQSAASEFLCEMARRHAGRLRVLATGAMTNLLGAAEQDGDFWDNVDCFSLMGGITEPLLVGGRPMAELNLSCDPEASFAVLTRGGLVQVATAQNCLNSWFPKDQCMALLKENGGPAARFLERELAGWFDVCERDWNLPGLVNWDVMAAAQLVHPEYFDAEEAVLTPTVDSLRTGMLLGAGAPVRVCLPCIREHQSYLHHIYNTYFAAQIFGQGCPGDVCPFTLNVQNKEEYLP